MENSEPITFQIVFEPKKKKKKKNSFQMVQTDLNFATDTTFSATF